MINNKSVLAIIPARGGSKGVPRKNIREVCGKPLIAWTIEEAKKSRYIDRLILSSDDMEIIEIAKKWGCEVPFVRPSYLAEDHTPGIMPVIDALKRISGFDYIVLLQPTSPLRNTDDIDGCIRHCLDKNSNACVSISEVDENPHWMYSLDANHIMRSVLNIEESINRRQDLPVFYSLNGAVYVAKCEWLLSTRSFISSETIGYPMPKDRSLDIDTEFDLKYLDFLLNNSSEIYSV